MDITICDTTAFEYWRIPPIVSLLLAGKSDDIVLRRILRPGELEAFRAAALAELPLCGRFLQPNPSMRGSGEAAELLRPTIPLIAATHDGPVDILVSQHNACHTSTLLRPRLWNPETAACRTIRIRESTSVVTPALALLQLAARASLTQTVMLASELCGSFVIYEAAPPHLQMAANDSKQNGHPGDRGMETVPRLARPSHQSLVTSGTRYRKATNICGNSLRPKTRKQAVG